MTTEEATTYQTWNFGRLDDSFPVGPWTGEPDKVQWVDPATDLDCLILRNRLGALCGYVGVPPQHPWHGNDYDDARAADGDWPNVHGGLTYADKCREDAGDDAICHVPATGRETDVWWLGFDCAHAGDLSPYDAKRKLDPTYPSYDFDLGDVYRPIDYVKAECANLARQAKAVAS